MKMVKEEQQERVVHLIVSLEVKIVLDALLGCKQDVGCRLRGPGFLKCCSCLNQRHEWQVAAWMTHGEQKSEGPTGVENVNSGKAG